MFRVVPVPKLSLSKEVKEGGERRCVDHAPRAFALRLNLSLTRSLLAHPASRLKRARIWPTARLLKDFNYYFLVILAAPYHTDSRQKGQFAARKMSAISCAERSLLEEEFLLLFSLTEFKDNIYTAANHNQQRNKRFHHYNNISYCLFDNTVLGFHSHTQSVSHRENFSFKAPLKYKQSKQKRTTLRRSSSHENIYKKYTCRKQCGEEVTKTIHSRKSKHSLTLTLTHTSIRYLLRFKIHHQIGEY